MASRPSNREEEFELVLGNKQLLSLFFIVVGFFAAFFSVGYMVGFGHGEKTGATAGIARVEEPAPKPAEQRLPSTLLEAPPEPPPTPVAASPKPSPTVRTSEPPPAAQPAAAPQPQPQPVAAAAPPKTTTPEAAPKPTPVKTQPAKPAAATPAKVSASGSYVLQVAAVRTMPDANQLAAKLKAKGYPATVNAAQNDGWMRIVVGPFESAEAAQAFKAKLNKDGFDTMLRKR